MGEPYIQIMNKLRQENIYNLNLFDDDVLVNEVAIYVATYIHTHTSLYYIYAYHY